MIASDLAALGVPQPEKGSDLLAPGGAAKIEKVTLNAVKLTAIFSKRRKIGAS